MKSRVFVILFLLFADQANSRSAWSEYATRLFGQDSEESWSRAIFIEPTDAYGPGWFLMGVDQEEKHLVGVFGYGKAFEEEKPSAPQIIEVTESSDGSLWLHVTLEVKDEAKGEWQRVGPESDGGNSKRITIAPGELKLSLFVNFDPFKTALDRSKEGRVIFSDGEIVSFPLHYLRPM